MFKHYFEQVHGIEIWPIISLMIFFVFFIALIWWVIRADKKYLKTMGNLPLANEDPSDKSSKNGLSINKKLVALVALGILSINQGFADSLTTNQEQYVIYGAFIFILIMTVSALLLTMYVLHVLTVILDKQIKHKEVEQHISLKKEPSWWSKLSQILNDSVPIDQEASIVMDHEYDGIRELDNHLPPWWKYMAYMSIVFAVIYMFVYHISGSMPLQLAEYEHELATAEIAKANMVQAPGQVIDENSLAFDDDPAVIASGKKVYDMQCVACHKAEGAGGIGPNLADAYWLHGGGIKDIFKTVRYGVPDKGMISWEGVLSLSKINDVTMYIRTLKGTTPNSPKGPQGELYSGE